MRRDLFLSDYPGKTEGIIDFFPYRRKGDFDHLPMWRFRLRGLFRDSGFHAPSPIAEGCVAPGAAKTPKSR